MGVPGASTRKPLVIQSQVAFLLHVVTNGPLIFDVENRYEKKFYLGFVGCADTRPQGLREEILPRFGSPTGRAERKSNHHHLAADRRAGTKSEKKPNMGRGLVGCGQSD